MAPDYWRIILLFGSVLAIAGGLIGLVWLANHLSEFGLWDD